MPFSAYRHLISYGLISLSLVLTACQSSEDSAATAQRPATPVAVAAVTPQWIERRLQALGTLLARDSIDVTATVSEKITALHFSDGQQVKAGDVLATLAQSEERALLDAAKADLAEQERELKRLEGLLARKVAAQTEYDQRQTAKLQAQARIEEVQAMLAERNIRAPFAGVVGLRRVSTGALVMPGEVITTLDDVSVMRMDFQVPALQLRALAPGQTVRAYSEALDASFDASITAIDSRIDPVARNVNVRAEIPNPDGVLKPGMLMRLQLISDRRQALLIPEQALQSIQDKHFVWLVDAKNQARRQEIELGLRKPGFVEARSGLKAGDKVVFEGYTTLQDGASVAPKEPS